MIIIGDIVVAINTNQRAAVLQIGRLQADWCREYQVRLDPREDDTDYRVVWWSASSGEIPTAPTSRLAARPMTRICVRGERCGSLGRDHWDAAANDCLARRDRAMRESWQCNVV